MTFHFNHESKDDDVYSNIEDNVHTLMKKINKIEQKNNLKAVIANQTYYDERSSVRKAREQLEQLKDYLGQCNIDTHYVYKPTINFFANEIYDYDIVVLCTHGGLKNDFVHTFISGEELGMTKKNWLGSPPSTKERLKWKENLEQLLANYILNDNNFTDQYVEYTWVEEERSGDDYWVGYPRIIETFIEEVPNKNFNNANSLLFSLSCHSLEGNNSLAEKYINRNLGVYYGYNKEVTFKTAAPAALNFFQLLLNGNSLYASTLKLPSKYKEDSYNSAHAQLDVVTNPNYSDDFFSSFFISPTYTIDLGQEAAIAQYNYSNSVEVEGYATILDKDNPDVLNALSFGFEYGGKYDTSWTRISTSDKISLSQTLDKGNVRFRAKLENLEPDHTYIYRAYTFDGFYYNYGEPYEFTTKVYPTLTLSTKSVSLKVGETSTIDITAGSGSYSIEKIEPEGVVSASISENHISIEALSGGTATITVKDDKSGDTAPIEVKVEWDHLSFAINGTVDLKVGESTTIDITSGSGSYSIEEIKPAGVVTASISENSVIIEALKAGTATITVKDDKSEEKAPIEVKVQVKDIPAEAIDLGLPSGILWASYNVGATTPEEYGSYFAWGEIEDKDVYYWTTYSHCDGVSNSCHDIGADISGTKFDVAHMRWEGDWRMPTAEEFKELVYKCDYQVTTQNGVYGFKFTGPNGNSIFFPAAGYRFNTGINKAGSSGEYWSSTVRENKNYAYDTSMSADYVYWDCYINRFAGLPVRPVKQAAPALEDLVLSTTSPISLKAGETSAVQIISGNGVYSIFDNTAPNVVTASISENNVIIEALTPGTATITVKDDKSGEKESIEVTVTENTTPIAYLTCPDDHHPHMIDLGLPSGTKWACCNVGADKPEDNGGYYAWGETEEKDIFTWGNYTHCDGTSTSCHNLGGDISGTKYDIAYVKWGENWCMPSYPQLYELNENCSYKMTTINGIDGRIYTGKNGGSIFLPMPGYRWYDELNGEGLVGMYWSSTQYTKDYSFAVTLYFNTHDECYMRYDNIAAGISVRPVAK